MRDCLERVEEGRFLVVMAGVWIWKEGRTRGAAGGIESVAGIPMGLGWPTWQGEVDRLRKGDLRGGKWVGIGVEVEKCVLMTGVCLGRWAAGERVKGGGKSSEAVGPTYQPRTSKTL